MGRIIFPNLAMEQKWWKTGDELRLVKAFFKRLSVGVNASKFIDETSRDSPVQETRASIPTRNTAKDEMRTRNTAKDEMRHKKRKQGPVTDAPTKRLKLDTSKVKVSKVPSPNGIITIHLQALFLDAWNCLWSDYSVEVNAVLQYHAGRHLWFASIECPQRNFEMREEVGSNHTILVFGEQGIPTSSGQIGYVKRRMAVYALQWYWLWTYSKEEWRKKWTDEIFDGQTCVVVGFNTRDGGGGGDM